MAKLYERKEPTRAVLWNGANLKEVTNFIGNNKKYVRSTNDDVIVEIGDQEFMVIPLGGYVVREFETMFSMKYEEFNQVFKPKKG